MSSSSQNSMATIDAFIREVGALEKVAEESNTEAGGYVENTDHPVKDVDDNTEDAEEGDRSAENSADVKEDQGPPSVDSTSEATAKVGEAPVSQEGSAADDHMQIGTNVQATGDDPSEETSKAKPGKDDDGYKEHTSHPAATDNEELDGNKYSADMSIEKLATLMQEMGNDLCASFAVGPGQQEQQYAPKQARDEAPEVSHQAGWELAGLLTGDFDKQAADSLVQNTLGEIIHTASGDADKVAEYLGSYFDAQQEMAQKQAEGGMPDPAQEMGIPQEGGLPPELAGGGEELGGGDELAALGGEEGLGGGEELGGGPEEGIADEEQLAEILDELGVSPEELEQALAEEAGAGGGEDLGGLGGGEELGELGGLGGEEELAGLGGGEEGLPGSPEELEVEAHDKAAVAKRGNASGSMRNYIAEVIQRSRRR